ncbi:MAG: SRPBCC domain-containing protein [Aldersonia sp.]|nr:SRPBCC domain-containing protein [Aldersonia sp.]
MTEYCTLVTPDTLRIERELPGPIERVWAFLTESDKRKTWMGAGDIEMRVGGKVEHVFRNAELTGQPDGPPPELEVRSLAFVVLDAFDGVCARTA